MAIRDKPHFVHRHRTAEELRINCAVRDRVDCYLTRPEVFGEDAGELPERSC